MCEKVDVAGQAWSSDRRRKDGSLLVRKRHPARHPTMGDASVRRRERVDWIRIVLLVAFGAQLSSSAAHYNLSAPTPSVPRQIKSLNVTTPENNDMGNMLKVGLEWVIPLDAETTGGMTLSGFRLRSARLTACANCMDESSACIAQRNQLPWV
ncbi:MAG: hypothetical protein ACPIOQ_65305, partial [Promethearchaeia archaeon]